MEKYKKLEVFMNGFEKQLCKFYGDTRLFGNRRFVPYRETVKVENGTYITIRCGFVGIYTMLNEMKDGNWMIEVADASFTIAFAKLAKEEQEEYNNIINNLKNQ